MRKNLFIGIAILLLLVVIYCLITYKMHTTPKGVNGGVFRRKSTGITIYENEKKIRDLSKSEMEAFVGILEAYSWGQETQEMKMNKKKYNIMIDFNNLSHTKLYLSRVIPNKSFFDHEDVCYTISDEIYNTVLKYIDN